METARPEHLLIAERFIDNALKIKTTTVNGYHYSIYYFNASFYI
jgi:hypothetical protein